MASLHAMAKYGERSFICFYPRCQIQFICLLHALIDLTLKSEAPVQI